MERLICEYTFHLRGAAAGRVSRQRRPSQRMPVSRAQRAFSCPEIDCSCSPPRKTLQLPVSLWPVQDSSPKTGLFCRVFFFGCVGSSLLHAGFLQLWRAGATLGCGAQASHCSGFSLRNTGSRRMGFSSCGSRALEHRLSSCGARAQLLCGMWYLPEPGLEPVSPALAGRFLTTAPPGKSLGLFCLLSYSLQGKKNGHCNRAHTLPDFFQQTCVKDKMIQMAIWSLLKHSFLPLQCKNSHRQYINE